MDNSVYNNQYVQNLIKLLLNANDDVDEKTCRRISNQLENERRFASIRDSVRKKYIDYAKGINLGCTQSWLKEVSLSETALHHACYEIETDLRILLARRKNLIGEDEQTGSSLVSKGKLAGITTYRLAKAHIIHINSICITCNQKRINRKELPCKITVLNTEIAIACGLYFIGKSYSTIPKDVRNEIIYTLNYRHTNQETLGIIFDTLKLT